MLMISRDSLDGRNAETSARGKLNDIQTSFITNGSESVEITKCRVK